ncbi:MAG: WVD2 family protein [Prevotella sp.]|jgi:hypothetical protein|nr:WVD2 family protein [Prevotella sp.]
MKHLTITIGLLFISGATCSQTAREEFDKYRQEQKAALSQYSKEKRTEFNNYRDSINAEYAKFLEETWKSFDLQRKEMGFKPMPKPPVYDPSKPIPDDSSKPAPVKPVSPVKPEPLPAKPVEPPAPKPAPVAPQYPLSAEFYGTRIRLQAFSPQSKHLSGASEKEVADYWRFLSKLSVSEWTDDALRIQRELSLNDWGMYLLATDLFKAYFPAGTENEQTIFSVFLLNQLGYRAKIGRTAGGELYPLVAFRNSLLNTSYFPFNTNGTAVNYFVLNPKRKKLSSIQTCGGEYGNDGRVADISISQAPRLADTDDNQKLHYQNKIYTLGYNRNLVDFYSNYPCVDFSIYANAPLDKQTKESLKAELSPQIAGKSQEEAVNFLLHFVQKAFSYKTDPEQFGYEKWNFAEETLVSSYSDCDDRAIFFAQLVKNLLGMEVVLLNYPNVHLATAVRFDNPQTTGSYVNYNNVKYLICDPTYINANLGMAMPQLRNTPIEVIPVR